MNTMATKDFKDIVVSLSHVAYKEDSFLNRVLEPQNVQIESTVQSLAIKMMDQLVPYIVFKLKEDIYLDNPRAAKFQTLSSIIFSYSKA